METARLKLRRGQVADAVALVAGLNDLAVAQWLINPPFPYATADAHRFLAQFDDVIPDWTGPYMIVARETNTVIGSLSLKPGADAVELTYWLSSAAHGRGYMTEAVAAYLQAARTEGAAEAIFVTTDPDNLASRAVLERAGFVLYDERIREKPTRRGATRQLFYRCSAAPLS